MVSKGSAGLALNQGAHGYGAAGAAGTRWGHEEGRKTAGKSSHAAALCLPLRTSRLPIPWGWRTVRNGAGDKYFSELLQGPRRKHERAITDPLFEGLGSQPAEPSRLGLVACGKGGGAVTLPHTRPSPGPGSGKLLPGSEAESGRAKQHTLKGHSPVTLLSLQPAIFTLWISSYISPQNVVPQTSPWQNDRGGYRFPGPWVRVFFS